MAVRLSQSKISPIRGAGENTYKGILAALNYGADIIVTLDGDGQHDPSEIPKLTLPILHNEADIVIGSRFLKGYNGQRYREIGNRILTGLYNFHSNVKVTDSQCGFRAFRREVAEQIVIEEPKFIFCTEFLVKARALKYRIIEVPVKCIYHKDFKENSSMNPIKHGLQVAVGTIKWRMKVEWQS